jgi:hypothetical protein
MFFSANCDKKCQEFDRSGLSVIVKDSTGRLGNHMFTYTTLMAARVMFSLLWALMLLLVVLLFINLSREID